MEKIDLLIEARWVIPVVPDGAVLEHSAIAIRNERIVDILAISDARQRYEAKQVMQLPQHALIPGLINLHTHAAMSLMRGIADDRALMPWLQEHIWPAEAQMMSQRFVRDGTQLAIAEMLKGGTTCFNDMYFFPASAAEAIVESGIRATLGLTVLEFPSAYASDADDYLRHGFEARDAYKGESRLNFALAPHAPYTVSDRTFEKVVTFADQLGLNVHLHLHETRDEISQSESQFHQRPLQRLSALGVLGPNVTLAHCVHLKSEEITTLAQHGCHVAHCPTSNLKLASGMAPIAQLLAEGVNVGIGTDGAASNNRLDMFAEMRLAALLAKGVANDATMVPANQVLAMATINAARALGIEQAIGSLEVGKLADIVAVDFSAAEMQPCYDPISHLVFVAGREHVSHTWVAGEPLYQNGEFPKLNASGHDHTIFTEISASWQTKLKPFHL